MESSSSISGIPKTKFHTKDPRFDYIAFKIIWERDQRLWQDYIVKKYPIFGQIKAWDEEKIKRLLMRIYMDHQDGLLKAQNDIVAQWGEIEADWYLFLMDIFESEVEDQACFHGYIGIAPIYPRDIERGSFLVPYDAGIQEMRKIIAHETSHFIFYRKVGELGLMDASTERLIWLMSEIMVPLLFGDKRAISIIGHMPQSSYVCTQSLIERCREAYQKRADEEIGVKKMIKMLMRVEIREGELNKKYIV